MDIEDSLVYCIKPERVVVDAAAAILAETATHIAGNKGNLGEWNPFVRDEDFEGERNCHGQ